VKRLYRLVGIVAAGAAGWLACDSGTGVEVSLDDVSEPDTNTVVVVLSRTVQAGQTALTAGAEYVYAVRAERISHTLLGELVLGGDTARVVFVLSELYDAGPVVTDGMVNIFYWMDLGGRRYDPVNVCVLDVLQAYVFGTSSAQRVETACRVRSVTGDEFTVYAKGKRFISLGGATAER